VEYIFWETGQNNLSDEKTYFGKLDKIIFQMKKTYFGKLDKITFQMNLFRRQYRKFSFS
jgi:hypothetical protein